MEIQVGEYVRTNQGYIAKLEDIDKEFMYFDNVIMCYYEETKLLPINVEMLDGIFLKAEDYVVKHSFNIIDLIEEGDFVNRLEIEKITEPTQYTNYKKTLYCSESEGLYKGVFFNNDIKSVVTHEQMEAMEYEVK